jgi:hypothetical protein
MAIEKKATEGWFHTGRGNVSGELAVSGKEVLSRESETEQGGMEAVPTDAGAKPIFATGERPFHEGRGLGRGHGPETK